MKEPIADVDDELLPSNKPVVSSTRAGWRLFWRLFICLFFVMFVIIGSFFIRFLTLYSYHEVEGISMQPTFNSQQISDEGPNDKVFVRKNAKTKVGDIIVFKQTYDFDYNGQIEKTLIKRVIAKAGDKVKIEEVGGDYILWVHFAGDLLPTNMNGKEDFVKKDVDGIQINASQKSYNSFVSLPTNQRLLPELRPSFTPDGYLLIGEGQFFVLGDNRNFSTDGTCFGAINQEQIVGSVQFIVSAEWSSIKRAFNNFRIMFIIKKP